MNIVIEENIKVIIENELDGRISKTIEKRILSNIVGRKKRSGDMVVADSFDNGVHSVFTSNDGTEPVYLLNINNDSVEIIPR